MGLFRATLSAVTGALRKTQETLTSPLRSILAGRTLDDALINEIEVLLLKADVGVQMTQVIITSLRENVQQGKLKRGEDVFDFLRTLLADRWRESEHQIVTSGDGPTAILVAGVNGVGKTTSVAKIAHSLREDGKSVMLAAADTFRAGAIEQLAVWSDRLGVDLIRGEPGSDPASVAFDAATAAKARNSDVLLIDTAGRLHSEESLMRQLTKIRDVVAKQIPGAPHEVLLVLDATQGQNALVQARHFQEAIDVSGLFLSKLDGTARGGIVLAVQDELGIPVKLIGTGERPEDVEPFHPNDFLEAMFNEGRG